MRKFNKHQTNIIFIMQALIKNIELLKKSSVGNLVKQRVKDFEQVFNSNNERWFSELCFCLLTANSSAIMGIKVQDALGFDGFSNLSQNDLTKRLQELGHRFYNVRAGFITEARKNINIKEKIQSFNDERQARDWLVEDIKGLGMKESSHFLRNVGYKNIAILDKHIINVLSEHNIIERPKNLNKQRYLDIEEKLEELAKATSLSLGELDLYLWYMKTGKVLK